MVTFALILHICAFDDACEAKLFAELLIYSISFVIVKMTHLEYVDATVLPGHEKKDIWKSI